MTEAEFGSQVLGETRKRIINVTNNGALATEFTFRRITGTRVICSCSLTNLCCPCQMEPKSCFLYTALENYFIEPKKKKTAGLWLFLRYKDLEIYALSYNPSDSLGLLICESCWLCLCCHLPKNSFPFAGLARSDTSSELSSIGGMVIALSPLSCEVFFVDPF